MTLVVASPVFRQALLGLVCWLASLLALADDGCRLVFDMGSSGIRAGTSSRQAIVHTEFDYLNEWWTQHSLKGIEVSTIAALRDLAQQAGSTAKCQKVGGGFSVWRLAAQANAGELADILARIHAATGVAVLVIPQQQEGAYGFFGSRQVLGSRLTTTHVLDIGGGSLQISGEHSSFGEALGQKIWHRELCRVIRNTDTTPCTLQPLSEKEVAIARSLLAERLKPAADKLSGTVTLTAISRPVSRNVLPAVKRIVVDETDHQGFSHSAIKQAIDHLAPLKMNAAVLLSGSESAYAAYLISDLLLVEGLLQATGASYLHIAEIDLTNIPGVLNDEHAFSWRLQYGCYLERLRHVGVPAYMSEPASCPQ